MSRLLNTMNNEIGEISCIMTQPKRYMAEQVLKKLENYWSAIHNIMGAAFILDPRDCDMEISRIRQLCYDLVYEYQAKKKEGSSSGFSSFKEGKIGDNDMSDFVKFMAKKKKARTSSMKTGLDHHLEEDNLPITSNFHILLCRKTNGLKYPTLQVIAKDVLAIPITIATSESAFSTNGQMLSPNHSRLNHATVEALMCTKS
uniref:AC transposase n=1 Tax=Cajanus cajan TaxID=3821 RepID=A0A151T2U6_CAJCA|nr:Putative AC transposase [Cajanus cajan]